MNLGYIDDLIKYISIIALFIIVLLDSSISLIQGTSISTSIVTSENQSFESEQQNKIIDKALTWFHTYFKSSYQDIYHYIMRNNLISIDVSVDVPDTMYTVWLSKMPVSVFIIIDVIDNKPFVSGYGIHIRSLEQDLVDIIDNYRDYGRKLLIQVNNVINDIIDGKRYPEIKMVCIIFKNRTRTDPEGNVFEKNLYATFYLQYGYKPLVLANVRSVFVKNISVSTNYSWRITSNGHILSIFVAGLGKLYRLASVLEAYGTGSIEWKISRSDAALFLSKKTNISFEEVLNDIKEYVAVIPDQGLKPVYYFKHIVEHCYSETSCLSNITSALILADTGDVYILNMVIPTLGNPIPMYKDLQIYHIFREQKQINTTTMVKQQSFTPISKTNVSSPTSIGESKGNNAEKPVLYIITGLIVSITVIIPVLRYVRVKS